MRRGQSGLPRGGLSGWPAKPLVSAKSYKVRGPDVFNNVENQTQEECDFKCLQLFMHFCVIMLFEWVVITSLGWVNCDPAGSTQKFKVKFPVCVHVLG